MIQLHKVHFITAPCPTPTPHLSSTVKPAVKIYVRGRAACTGPACPELTTEREDFYGSAAGAPGELRGFRFISDFTSLWHPSCQRLIVESFGQVHTGCSAYLHLYPPTPHHTPHLLPLLQTHTQSYRGQEVQSGCLDWLSQSKSSMLDPME